jgi:uncharacterized protein YutD
MEKLVYILRADIDSYLKVPHHEILFNERDFQMHIATYLKETGHYDDVDLEYFVPKDMLDGYKDLWDSELRLDILVRKGAEYCPVELKYKTKQIKSSLKRFGVEVDEVVIVKNQGAQDLGMYGFWKDVKRVEMVKEKFDSVKSGLSVFLTNDEFYKKPSRETSNNREFCMCEGLNSRSKHWQRESRVTVGHKGFDLSKDYHVTWDEAKFGEHVFHFCIVEI